MINRLLFDKLRESLHSNKVKILIGARRTGKTYLIKKISSEIQTPYLFLNGEDMEVHSLLENRSIQNYRNILGDVRLLIIDEAQKIPGIGEKLKLMIDEIDGLSILITGSSAFDLEGKMGEPLTGRKRTFTIFPLSDNELLPYENLTERRANLDQRLVYGNYPEVISLPAPGQKEEYLRELVNSYLLKDILQYEQIRKPSQIVNLLRLLAFQVGSEANTNELAQQVAISRGTVEKYLDLLSKVFVIYKLEGFSRNLRKEVTKNSKWYFYDNGIRNALIANFNPVNLRNDTGQLWENYVITERIKHQSYSGMSVNNYFWRTYDRQEVDFVEERGGGLYACEMKWKKEKAKVPVAWRSSYPESEWKVITPENYVREFLT